MLIRIFAMIGAVGSVLSALFANCGYKGAKLGGFMMLRFLEYFSVRILRMPLRCSPPRRLL